MLRSLLFFLVAIPGLAQIDELLQTPVAQRTLIGIHAIDLSTGAIVYSRNATLPMTPASNMKLFSTALALLRLGPDYHFETRVFAAGAPSTDGVLHGDLRLVGGGDTTLSARAYPYKKGAIEGDAFRPLAELADQLVRAGVRTVHGDIVGDDTRYPYVPYPDGWAIGDVPWEYGAPVSALILNDNAVSLTMRPPKTAGEPVSVSLSPATEHLTIYNALRVQAGAETRIDVDRAAGSRVLRLTGVVRPGTGASSQLIAVDDPALFAAETLASLLQARGVAILGTSRAMHRLAGEPYFEPQGVVLARRSSPPLSEIVRVVDKVSQNLHAEIMLREVEFVRKREARKELADMLDAAGIRKEEYAFQDGSGLTRGTLVSPNAVASLLRYMAAGEYRDLFSSLLPIGGEDGTLSTRFRGLAGASAIHAKTGTISHVAALSGYAGDHIAFSILTNHATAPSSEVRALIDKLALAILQQGKP